MKVCLDARVITGAPSGIPRLAANVITRMTRFPTEHEFVLLLRPGISDPCLRPSDDAEIIEVDIPAYSLREQVRIPKLVRRLGCDLYHCFTYAAPLRQVCKSIMSVYDLTQLEFPQYVGILRGAYVKHVTRATARRSWRVMTISEYSRWAVCGRFEIAPEKVFVAYAAVDTDVFTPGDVSINSVKNLQPYILNVSNKWPHKNAAAVVQIVKRIAGRCEHKLVMVGEQNAEVRGLIGRLGLEDRVVIRTAVADEELVDLYRGADVFLFPSLSEGFGMTPMEAMACGAPTISSYATSLAEVLDDAALLFCPYDVEHMAEAVLQVLNDSQLRNELRRRGMEQAKVFTWDDAARRILDVYEEACADD
ncbi:MAG: glycosyltransferase family 4 protein [Planctomycetes bacterium]|nr:glycosyltransferase family 4 protein [Planctomycetota bacterium]